MIKMEGSTGALSAGWDVTVGAVPSALYSLIKRFTKTPLLAFVATS